MTALLELASGVDSLYLSGRCELPDDLWGALDAARELAREQGEPTELNLFGYDWQVKPGLLHLYRYRLDHPLVTLGLSPSEHLPSLYAQFRAEGIHSLGADGVVRWLTSALANADVEPQWSVSRIDLHADWQGWELIGDQRHRFICRSRTLVTYEEGDALSGFSFGRRTSHSRTARIYDKTAEMQRTGNDWLPDLWGKQFDPDLPVLRVEFEFGRNTLRDCQVDTPTETLANADRLWAYATQNWLTYRRPTDHACAFRWPIAPEWTDIQRATLAGSAVPMNRITAGKTAGSRRRLMPALNGYLASFAALTGNDTIEDACDALPAHARAYELRSRRSFCDRVHEKRRQQP